LTPEGIKYGPLMKIYPKLIIGLSLAAKAQGHLGLCSLRIGMF
jgi:hypothetical protein